jgi:chromosome segregation ATPase
MESIKATSILNDIMQKLSLIEKPEVKAEEVEVSAEEVVAVEETIQEEVQLSEEVKDEVVEETTDLSEELAEEPEAIEEVVEEEVEEEELDEEKYVGRDEFESKISELKEMIEGLKMEKEEEKVEMSKQIEKLSAEPAATPIKHNPEESKSNAQGFKFGQNQPQTTLNRVMSKLI